MSTVTTAQIDVQRLCGTETSIALVKSPALSLSRTGWPRVMCALVDDGNRDRLIYRNKPPQ